MNSTFTKTRLSFNGKRFYTTVNLALLAFVISFSSCRSYQEIPYFQDLKRTGISEEEITNYSSLTIQPNDILGVNVISMNAEAAAVFNFNGDNDPAVGYIVTQTGEVKLPLLGVVKVSGLTTQELQNQLQKSLLTYVKEPVVNVRVLNFKISVLGDVLRPDVYSVPGERITVTEALSLAGDLNITGVRNILLVRENNGKREYVPIDLKSKSLFNSPYFYLKNNDMIYVDPHKTKLAIVENSKFSVLLSIFTVVGFALAQTIR